MGTSEAMPCVRGDVSKAVGGSDLVRLRAAEGDRAAVLAKLELQNPLGSVKDRIAAAMLDAAEASGKLRTGGLVVEPTSGNTGVALAGFCSARGYRLVLSMPESMSRERRRLLTHLGAEIALTPAAEGMRGAVAEAERIAAENGQALILDQFSNPANPEIHRRTTGEEIWQATGGRVDCFVAGVGTGGTLSGVAGLLKSKNPEIRAVAVEPAASPVLSGGDPGKHAIQGIGAGFLPRNLRLDIVDEVLQVTDAEALEAARGLARRHGLLAGISSGAAVRAAFEVADRPGSRGRTVVTLLPDTAERYLSTELFRSEEPPPESPA